MELLADWKVWELWGLWVSVVSVTPVSEEGSMFRHWARL